MAFFSNAQETSGRYGGYIAEFRELFGKHEVKFGKPADFLQLNPKLAHDAEFRSEFTALTKSVGQREKGRLTRTRVLTIVAIALSGPELEKLEKNAVSISLLGVFLAGVGGWCEAEPELEAVPAAVANAVPEAVQASVLEAVPEAAQEAVPEVVPEAVLETVPEAVPEAVLKTVPEASPETVLETVREAVPEAVPETVLEAVPEAVPEAVAAKVEKKTGKREETGGWGAIVAAVNDGSENEEEKREARELEQRLSAGPRSDLEGSTTSLFGGTALVKEALSRLEINALELKLHLDSIDHRMERIEPHLDDLTARIGPTVESLPLPETNGWPKGLPMQKFSLAEVAEPREAEQKKVEVEASKVDVVVPPVVSEPGGTTQPRWLYWVMAALLLLAGAAGVFFYGRHARVIGESRIAGTAGVSSTTDAMHGLDPPGRGGGNGAAGPGVNLQRDQGATGQTERQRVQAAGQGGQGSLGGQVRGLDRIGPNQSGSGKTGLSQTGPGTEIRTEFGNRPGKIHVAKEEAPPPTVASNVHIAAGLPGAVASVGMPSVGRLGTPDPNASAPAARSATDAAGSTATSTQHRAVFVPASALAHNLIASPRPTYPQVAHFQRTEGDVMVRALISERGTVESVSVVSGPTVLRQAALDAMRSWRYRPYLMSGKAVEVQTYVDFHFSLAR